MGNGSMDVDGGTRTDGISCPCITMDGSYVEVTQRPRLLDGSGLVLSDSARTTSGREERVFFFSGGSEGRTVN